MTADKPFTPILQPTPSRLNCPASQFQWTTLVTSSTIKHYLLDSEDNFRSGCGNISHRQQVFFIFQNYPPTDDHTVRTTDTPGFKLFTINRVGHLPVTTAKHFKLMRITVHESDNVAQQYLVVFVVKWVLSRLSLDLTQTDWSGLLHIAFDSLVASDTGKQTQNNVNIRARSIAHSRLPSRRKTGERGGRRNRRRGRVLTLPIHSPYTTATNANCMLQHVKPPKCGKLTIWASRAWLGDPFTEPWRSSPSQDV